MTRPAVWSNDPECGHDVDHAYQTHYCSYIRVPRLLTLQAPQTPDELFLITAVQWFELWFKVLRVDLQAALASDVSTLEPLKLLQRGIAIFKLFDRQLDLVETIVVRELETKKRVRASAALSVSEQLSQLIELARPLAAWAEHPQLRESIREYQARLDSFRARYNQVLHATLTPDEGAAPSFREWLQLPTLLDLQQGIKSAWMDESGTPEDFWQPEHVSADENMFIVVHQCSEIYFKVILDLIDRAIPALLRGEIQAATRLMRRVVLIQQLLVEQIQLPATILPLDFMIFRQQRREREGKVLSTGLTPASGTESYQFREIEIVSGLRDDAIFQKYLRGTERLPIRLLTPRQAERLTLPTLPEAFYQAVLARGVTRLDDIFTPSNAPNPNGDLALLGEVLLDFDEFFRRWRFNHVTMVEKMIGAKSGTGFLGPEYLFETAGITIQQKNRVFEERQVRPRFFEELWAVRTRMGSY